MGILSLASTRINTATQIKLIGSRGFAPAGELVKFIDQLMDKLLLDYLKANPKK